MFGRGRKFFGLRGIQLQLAVGAIAGIDFLLFGFDQGVTGSLLTLRSFRETFPRIDTLAVPQPPNASTIQGITVASYNLGCFCGAIACIFLGNPLGRKRTIFLGTCIMVVGAIIQASSYQLAQLIIGRIVTGLGNGLNTSTVPTWQSECSKSHRRGQLVMIEGALITAGIMVAYWLDFGFYFLDPNPVSWRFPLAFQIFFCLIILAFVMKLPESPRWLIFKGREDEALEVLAALSDADMNDKSVHQEFIAIKDTVLEASSTSFKDLWTNDSQKHRTRVILAYTNQMFQQISGINLITYYLPNVLEAEVGLSPFLAKLIAACNGTEYFLASWIAVFIIEKVGRRKLMLFGAAGMSICMVILAAMQAIGGGGPGIVETVFLFGFNTVFAIGWLGMTWLYPAEIVPLKIRAPANAVSTSANWIWNFAIVMITPVAFDTIGYKTYVIFAVINAAIIPCVYFFFPETAYRSLEEMDAIFEKSTSIFNIVSVARNEPRRYGKNGESLINYEETDMHRRRSSATATGIPPLNGREKQESFHADV